MRSAIFFQLAKVDEAKRLVYGVATAEVADKAGEILDYDSSVPYFKAWSADIAKASGGKSLGNVREMHNSHAVGKLTELECDDAAKLIKVCAKIVEDSTWQKVLEGVLTGFSIGGDYVKRWKDSANAALTRFTANPAEISVVDNPCVGIATFEYIKADGTVEKRNLHSVAPAIDKKAVGKLLKQVWSATDGKTFDEKEEAVKYQAKIDADAAAAENPAIKKATDALKEINDQLDALGPEYWETEEYEAALAKDCIETDGLKKREFTEAKRKEMAETGHAMPDGSFPIANAEDLHNAIQAHGRAKDPEKAKAHIVARAKEMGMSSVLPDGWMGAGKADAAGDLKKDDDSDDLEKRGRHSAADKTKLAEMNDHVDDMGDHIEKMHKMHKAMMDCVGAMGDSTHSEHVEKMKAHLGKLDKCFGKAEATHEGMEGCMKCLGLGSEGEGGQNGDAMKPKLDAGTLEKLATVDKLEADNGALTKTVTAMTEGIEALKKRLHDLEQQPNPFVRRPAVYRVEKANEVSSEEEPGGLPDDQPNSNPFGSGQSPEQARRR